MRLKLDWHWRRSYWAKGYEYTRGYLFGHLWLPIVRVRKMTFDVALVKWCADYHRRHPPITYI